MKIDRKTKIGGQPIKLVRDLMKRDYVELQTIVALLRRYWWEELVETMFERGEIDRDSRTYMRKNFEHLITRKSAYGRALPRVPAFEQPAQVLLDALISDGYIEPPTLKNLKGDPMPTRDGKPIKGLYKSTVKGAALSMKHLQPRMNRAKAEELLRGVLDRVAAINADPDMMWGVSEVRVFGSYLTDTDDLGDLDLGISYYRRPIPGGLDAFRAAMDAFMIKHNKQHLSWQDQLGLPERMTKLRIKNRSPYISLHAMSELDSNPDFGGKTIYTFTPPEGSLHEAKFKPKK